MQLEVGKKYVNRRGEVVKIVENDVDHDYPFRGDNDHIYTPSGGVYLNAEDEKDLISEVHDTKPCQRDDLAKDFIELAIKYPVCGTEPKDIVQYAFAMANAFIKEMNND